MNNEQVETTNDETIKCWTRKIREVARCTILFHSTPFSSFVAFREELIIYWIHKQEQRVECEWNYLLSVSRWPAWRREQNIINSIGGWELEFLLSVDQPTFNWFMCVAQPATIIIIIEAKQMPIHWRRRWMMVTVTHTNTLLALALAWALIIQFKSFKSNQLNFISSFHSLEFEFFFFICVSL